MKWLKEVMIVLLLVVIAVLFVHDINLGWKLDDVNEQLDDWQDAYAKLAITHDTLDEAYASLKKEFAIQDSMYKKRLNTNKLWYEKIIAGFDTLTIDEHVMLLSSFLSEKDSIRK